MRRLSIAGLLIVGMSAAIGAFNVPPLSQEQTPEANERSKFNQVFVKVILPVTNQTPMQKGPAVESWIAKQLKQRGESEYYAVTDWVPICDGLLEDESIDNDVWDGILESKQVRFCPVFADIPERENGRVTVLLSGWAPGAPNQVTTELSDEPGTRVLRSVEFLGSDGKPIETDVKLPYYAVVIAPPPVQTAKSPRDPKNEPTVR